ncbi:hypothetical protein B5M43_011785 [Microbacterium sp. MEC084]|nr:hypothetical protein [Microbacterium sp. MEC084]
MLSQARERSTISLDPNIRPALLADHAAVVDRFERLARLADIVKMSDEDREWLYPGEGADAVAARLVETGAPLVVVTRGAHGAIAMTRDGSRDVAPVATSVVDTVGAGDSFMSALLGSLHAASLLGAAGRVAFPPGALEPHLSMAARAAAITVSRAGANPPDARDLLQ